MNDYAWPLDAIKTKSHNSLMERSIDEIQQALKDAGYGVSLNSFISTLYSHADGATFFRGALRLHPFDGVPAAGLPDLIDWNRAEGWKKYEPQKYTDTFYFLSNAFGDLMGIPITDNKEIRFDRVAILWTEKRLYQEAGVQWSDFFVNLGKGLEYANYFGRIQEYEWATSALGSVNITQCFSSKIPAILGGKDNIDNVTIQSLCVHVSFTLQILKQWAEGLLTPGAPLPLVDLYDDNGRLL